MAASNPFTELVGNTLQSHQGNVDVSTLTSKKAVLLYFSAHWCPPCRGFTPELVKYYKSHAEKFNFEIIFVSSDKDDKQFDEYFAEMPWKALPFKDRDTKAKLSKKYKVQGIPTLVVLDAAGQLITTNGRSKVSSAPEDFPWTPKTLYQILDNGPLLQGKDGKVEVASLKEKEAVGIYFSAHWCPPCRAMTPKIVQTYNVLKSAGKAFEVIFASSDNDEHSFKEYYAEMPWLAFPWKDGRIDELSELYEVEGIPTFVVIDTKTWKTITVEGTSAVGTDPTGKDFPWHPKPLNNVDNAGGAINSDPCFIYLDSNLTDATTAHLQQVAESYVNKWNSAGSEHPLKFFWGKSGGLADRIKQFLKIEEDPVLVILNLSDGEYYKQGGAADLKVFSDTAEKFLAHQLTFTKLN
eukprot:TRINITY_DN25_c0_g1_i4.p1 TRINITY_DN25_c0_g1~~TRINITY_DN25_c0_g1_i4.p1  ORF type:complete len:424 (-),score=74.95 TRINITY_DN25_c0_g1_i4:42-1265(-)